MDSLILNVERGNGAFVVLNFSTVNTKKILKNIIIIAKDKKATTAKDAFIEVNQIVYFAVAAIEKNWREIAKENVQSCISNTSVAYLIYGSLLMNLNIDFKDKNFFDLYKSFKEFKKEWELNKNESEK